jgi:transposase-like protein
MAERTKSRLKQVKGLLAKSQALQSKMRAAAKTEKAAKKKTGTVGVGGLGDWDDPSLSAADLLKIARTEPRAYTNPNLPLDVLVMAAKTHPWYVEQNPVLGLLFLEEPAVQEKMAVALAEGWRVTGLNALTPRNQRLYACDCAEHVLHFFEEKYPDDKRPRKAINVARHYANGDQTVKKAKLSSASSSAHDGAYPASKEASRALEEPKSPGWLAVYHAANSASHAANSAADSAAERAAIVVRDAAAKAVISAASAASAALFSASEAASEAAREAEGQWQEDRVRHYYAMEHPEYQRPEAVGARTAIYTKEMIEDELQRGGTHAEMAKRLGIPSHQYFTFLVHKYGLYTQTRHADYTREEVEEALRPGGTYIEAAKRMGVDRAYFTHLVQRFGLGKPSKKPKKTKGEKWFAKLPPDQQQRSLAVIEAAKRGYESDDDVSGRPGEPILFRYDDVVTVVKREIKDCPLYAADDDVWDGIYEALRQLKRPTRHPGTTLMVAHKDVEAAFRKAIADMSLRRKPKIAQDAVSFYMSGALHSLLMWHVGALARSRGKK